MGRNILLGLLSILALTACAPKTEYVHITKYEYVTYDVPSELFNKCTASKPISAEEYSKLTDEKREEYLANYSIRLLGDVKKCDNRLQSVKKFVEESNKLIREAETKHEREEGIK